MAVYCTTRADAILPVTRLPVEGRVTTRQLELAGVEERDGIAVLLAGLVLQFYWHCLHPSVINQ
ncbi:hypothetical protein ACLQ3F_06350 [Micromonospora sp. DT15]